MKKGIGAGEDVAVDVKPKVLNEGDDAVKEFRDTSPIGGGVHMGNAFSFERFRNGVKCLVGRLPDDRTVIREVLRRNGDFLHFEASRGGRPRGSLDVAQPIRAFTSYAAFHLMRALRDL